ncbi:MAG: hypothetical protein Q8P80_04735 [Candidatus Levybacteria bacterium]|nr:hypothetical protein [Candidatus Levybacteria bacterium]
MGKQPARKNINFRETKSERSATNSYRGFGKYIKERFNKYIIKGKGKLWQE